MARSPNMDSELGVGGWPLGYFMIKNSGNGKFFDVSHGSAADGTPIVLYDLKEPSRVISLRDPAADNQVFFIDLDGNLCSRLTGHAIDVEGGKLVLRHRRPISFPFPNTYSHPLPIFEVSLLDRRILIRFPGRGPADAAPFMLAAVPLRKPRSMFDTVGQTLTTAATTVLFAPLTLTGLGGPSKPTSSASVDDIDGADFTLRDHELDAQDVVGDEDADDSLERWRQMRVVPSTQLSSTEASLRAQWEVVPILRERIVTGAS